MIIIRQKTYAVTTSKARSKMAREILSERKKLNQIHDANIYRKSDGKNIWEFDKLVRDENNKLKDRKSKLLEMAKDINQKLPKGSDTQVSLRELKAGLRKGVKSLFKS